MHSQVMILSGDREFSRLLELEFEYLHLQVKAAASWTEDVSTEVLILDLDSAQVPPEGSYRIMIGFSRRPATATEEARQCSMILRRPFRMSLLRSEVLRQTGNGSFSEQVEREGSHFVKGAGRRKITLDATARLLRCDGQTVAVSPQECRLLQCLLEHRGRAVARETLSSLIGESSANKTDVYICYLRRKTDGLPGGRLIMTVRGEGYCIQ